MMVMLTVMMLMIGVGEGQDVKINQIGGAGGRRCCRMYFWAASKKGETENMNVEEKEERQEGSPKKGTHKAQR